MSTDTEFLAVTFPHLGNAGANRLDEAARARGHAAGYAEGLRQAASRMAEQTIRQGAEHAAALQHAEARAERILGVLAAAAAALNQRTVPLLRDIEGVIVATAIDLAEAILGAELSDAESAARRALERALDHDHPAEAHTVRMHPDDLDLLDSELLARTGLNFAADPKLARGDAMTDFPEGFLDARIGTALLRARAALQGAPQ